jgi:uncharacterized protein (TIGR00730 family)
MAERTSEEAPLPRMLSRDAWTKSWDEYWSKAGSPGYELPVGGPGGEEREFLADARTPEKEWDRLDRINDEFIAGFKGLFEVGPAVTVFGSARFGEDHHYYGMARAVGSELAKAGFAVLTGGGPGIMEAANRGAHEAGGSSYGLTIMLPHEQRSNPYVDKSLEFHYFFTRKVCLVKYSCAFIIMPGGLGTLDELFEAATLIQCHKIGPFPLILMGTEFWKGFRRWAQSMMREGVFSRDEIGFAYITDSPQKAAELIVAGVPPSVRERLVPPGTASRGAEPMDETAAGLSPGA